MLSKEEYPDTSYEIDIEFDDPIIKSGGNLSLLFLVMIFLIIAVILIS